MRKQTYVLFAMSILAGWSVAHATPATIDPSAVDHAIDQLMSSYHVQYRTIGGTSLEWTPDGGQHDYLVTLLVLPGDAATGTSFLWQTDIPTFMSTPEGYGGSFTYPVTPTNLLEASDLILIQKDMVWETPSGPHLFTTFNTVRSFWITDQLPAAWPTLVSDPATISVLVPEPSAVALAAAGLLALVGFSLRRRPTKIRCSRRSTPQ